MLTLWIATLVLCLEASVTLWSQTTIVRFLIDAAHTVVITYVILVVIFLVRVINHAEYPDAVDGTDDAATPPRYKEICNRRLRYVQRIDSLLISFPSIATDSLQQLAGRLTEGSSRWTYLEMTY